MVRDVAAVSGTSMLVRRDLMRGLGAIDDHLATEAAAIDFCQRARLRGARVVLVPSSEVLHPAPSERKTPPWREEAGRVRAMIKVYSWVTLLWALPGAFLTGLLEAIAAPVLGRWTLFNWVRTWGWNILFLPSTLIERHRARKGRVVNEGELFRYQLRGSARLRAFGSEAATWLEERFPERAGAGFTGIVEAGQETMRSPGFVSAPGRGRVRCIRHEEHLGGDASCRRLHPPSRGRGRRDAGGLRRWVERRRAWVSRAVPPIDRGDCSDAKAAVRPS